VRRSSVGRSHPPGQEFGPFAPQAECGRQSLPRAAPGPGDRQEESADERLDLALGGPAEDLLAVHDALEQFAAHDPVKARLVELRFFAGLTLEQAAEALTISVRTAKRDWQNARAFLYAALQ